MVNTILSVPVPKESIYKEYISKIDFKDAYRATLTDNTISIETIYLNAFVHSPKWIDNFLILRNKIVGVFGLKINTEKIQLSKEDLKVDSKVGIFRIYAVTNNEIIAGEDDKHLNFRVSVLKQNCEVTISTLVQYNNLFGKVYMTLIMPFHKLIVRSMLKNAVKNKRI